MIELAFVGVLVFGVLIGLVLGRELRIYRDANARAGALDFTGARRRADR